jgi:hypothetical protein
MNLSKQKFCRNCVFFDGDPQSMEVRIAGLRTLGSGFASVRDQDGLCEKHERYISATATCANFASREVKNAMCESAT